MEHIGLYIYLIGVVTGVKFVLVVVGCLMCLFGVTGMIVYYTESHKHPVIVHFLTVVGILIFLISILIPDSKTLTAMVFVPQIVNNEQVQGITQDSLTLIHKKLNEWLNDIDSVDIQSTKATD